jgi:two-component system chemotaxis response regulator CheB
MKRVRVLIVEDSAVVREHLRRIISSDPRLDVAGLAVDGEEAVRLVEQLEPDVISMDIQLPGIQGFEATRQIMSRRPTPIVVVSGMANREMNLSMQALRCGALAVVEKPVSATHESYQALAARLCTQLVIMSEVKVVRQRDLSTSRTEEVYRSSKPIPSSRYMMLGLVASTGGPNAIVQVLNGLGAGFPLPVALVQHMTPGFVGGFAEWLESVTPFRVVVLHGRMTLEPGTVWVAPSGSHLVVDGRSAFLNDGPPVGSHRPSGNVLFSSMARSLGSGGIGVLLTGMGDDGAVGLRELRESGGFTIAEAESTAVVYGMPAAAVNIGAAREVLPLGDVATRILTLPMTKPEGE